MNSFFKETAMIKKALTQTNTDDRIEKKKKRSISTNEDLDIKCYAAALSKK